MLIVAKTLAQLDYDQLMTVYKETNLENGRKIAPYDSASRQQQIAEDLFYNYLRECFYDRKGAIYCILSRNNQYISALRVEPYQDGLLIEALETVPHLRKQGYAGKLLSLMKEYLCEHGGTVLYSHVSKKNHASQSVHEKAGFRRICDFAAYIDGSISNRAYTYALKLEDSIHVKM